MSRVDKEFSKKVTDGIIEKSDGVFSFFLKHSQKLDIFFLASYSVAFLLVLLSWFSMNIYTVDFVYKQTEELTTKTVYLIGIANSVQTIIFMGILGYLYFQMKLLVKDMRKRH